MSKIITTILSLLFLSSCYLSGDIEPDQDIWAYGQPDDTGLSDINLLALNESISRDDYGLIDGMVIIKDDQLVFENYYNSGERQTLKSIDRASFTISILLFDQFIENGLINNIDDPIYTYLPQYDSIFNASPTKREITFRHLLTHKSGLIWNESIVSPLQNTSDFQLMRTESKDDWTLYILSKQLESMPGTRVSFNSGSGIILATVYQNLLAEESLNSYIDKIIFDPLSISYFEIEETPEGSLNLARGVSLSTLDYSKIGYLILQEGRWKDRSRVLSRDWVLDVTSLETVFSERYGIGLGWWVFTDSFLNDFLPDSGQCIFIAGGSGDNLYVLPSLNMVVSITADNHFENSIFNSSLLILLESVRITSSEPNN